MSKRILFFSGVKDVALFHITGFYVEDIKALRDAGYMVNTTNKWSDFLKFWQYDIAFLYFYTRSLLPAFLALLFGKKRYYTGGIDSLHEHASLKFYQSKAKVFFLLNYLLANRCNIVSLTDLSYTQELLASVGIRNTSKKLIYFPHSITISNQIESVYPKENMITSICWMATIANVKRKGLDKLLYAFKTLLIDYPAYQLYLIGSWGEGKDYLAQIVQDLDLTAHVIFTGQIAEEKKLSILAKSKYYFQLSTYEGFGIAVIEAMALNNYIFHSNKGGLKDTVGERGTIITDPDDVAAIHMAFQSIDHDYESYSSLLQQNRILTIEKFSTNTRTANFKHLIN